MKIGIDIDNCISNFDDVLLKKKNVFIMKILKILQKS